MSCALPMMSASSWEGFWSHSHHWIQLPSSAEFSFFVLFQGFFISVLMPTKCGFNLLPDFDKNPILTEACVHLPDVPEGFWETDDMDQGKTSLTPRSTLGTHHVEWPSPLSPPLNWGCQSHLWEELSTTFLHSTSQQGKFRGSLYLSHNFTVLCCLY